MAPVLTNLTREILRTSSYSSQLNSAEDLSAFAYSYFMDALAAEQQESPVNDGVMSTEDLIQKVEVLFVNADADGNGVLDRKEFKQIFQSLKDELGLSVCSERAHCERSEATTVVVIEEPHNRSYS